jgi:hypothetical protein
MKDFSTGSPATPLPRDIRAFLDEVASKLGEEAAAQWRTAFEALDREGDEKPHAVKALQAFGIIVSRPRPFYERLEALHAVLAQPPGHVTVKIKLGAD